MDEQTRGRARCATAARRAGHDRRRRNPRGAWRRWSARCSAPASAAARASTSTPTPRTRRATCCTSTSPGSACPTSPTTATSSTPRFSPRIRSTSPRCSPSCTAGEHAETAARIVALETKLAAAHWDVVKRRDADLTYNLRTFADLPAEAPGFDWAGWVTALGTTPEAVAEVVVRQPDYLTAFAAAWSGEDLEDWKNWARWRLIHARAALLTDDLVAEDFAFYGRTAERHRGDPRPLEARRVGGREPDGRCRRQAVRRAALPAGCQGAHGRIGRQPARGLPRQHQRPRVDDAADAREGAGQAGQVHPEDRLSGQVAGLLEAGHRARRPLRQLPARP